MARPFGDAINRGWGRPAAMREAHLVNLICVLYETAAMAYVALIQVLTQEINSAEWVGG